jgi:hypothetical protein
VLDGQNLRSSDFPEQPVIGTGLPQPTNVSHFDETHDIVIIDGLFLC